MIAGRYLCNLEKKNINCKFCETMCVQGAYGEFAFEEADEIFNIVKSNIVS